MGESNKPIVILVGGGHAAGKSLTCTLIENKLEQDLKNCRLLIKKINMKSYIFSVSAKVSNTKERISLPSRFNFDLLKSDIIQLLHLPKNERPDIILVHGLYALYDKELRHMSQMKIFVNGDADTRLARWVEKEVLDGTNKLEDVLSQYLNFARPEMNEFILPTKEFADVILPRGAEESGVNLIVDWVQPLLNKKSSLLDELESDELNLRPKVSPPVTREHNVVMGVKPVNFSSEQFNNQKERFYELD